ncbi:hypothetical protein TRVL_02948 [Trypanosoma vivax]|nr:hypothetical protein TRVL_02948 [Trypanosoma vivax]
MSVMEKGGARSDALMRGPSLIDGALQEQGVQPSWDYISSAENRANGISWGNRLRDLDVARGWHMRRSAEGAVVNALPLPPSVCYTFQTLSLSNEFVFSL